MRSHLFANVAKRIATASGKLRGTIIRGYCGGSRTVPPPHDAVGVTNFLNETFPNRWIGLRSPQRRWPARSPDDLIWNFHLLEDVPDEIYYEMSRKNVTGKNSLKVE